jgi:hypothetical protein
MDGTTTTTTKRSLAWERPHEWGDAVENCRRYTSRTSGPGHQVLIDAHSNSQSVREEESLCDEAAMVQSSTGFHLMFGSGNAAMTKTVVAHPYHWPILQNSSLEFGSKILSFKRKLLNTNTQICSPFRSRSVSFFFLCTNSNVLQFLSNADAIVTLT